METRKIVRSGNSSYILALPIKWVRNNGLETKRTINITESNQGDLILSKSHKEHTEDPIFVTIKIDDKDFPRIRMEFLDAYIKDAQSIFFEGKTIPKLTSKILEATRNFIGLDVMEQSNNAIVVKNFFRLDKETSPLILLRKMDLINRSMFTLIQKKTEFVNEDYFEMQKLFEQSERLFLLVKKSISKLHQHSHMLRELQSDYIQLSWENTLNNSYFTIARNIRGLARSWVIVEQNTKSGKILQSAIETTIQDYQQIVNILFNNQHQEIQNFMIEMPTRSALFRSYFKKLEDPVIIQCLQEIINIYRTFRLLCYETM